MKENFTYGTAAFIMPHWRTDNGISRQYLDEAIKGLFAQTDKNWKLVIVDDCSPCDEAIEYILSLEKKHSDKINVILNKEHVGAWHVRNTGIKWAYENNYPIILFNDADDISNNRRLEVVRRKFIEDKNTDVVYSTFKIIDENGNRVADENISPCIYETLEGHKNNIVQGKNAWIEIGTEKNYTNLTSSTSVRTKVAYSYPFPNVKTSEDSHTWLRYGANGGNFVYCPEIPSLYRIPSNIPSSSRARFNDFYRVKAEVDIDGFMRAMEIAIAKGNFDLKDKDDVLIRFYIKLAESLSLGEAYDIASEQVINAAKISYDKTRQVINERGLNDKCWVKFQ